MLSIQSTPGIGGRPVSNSLQISSAREQESRSAGINNESNFWNERIHFESGTLLLASSDVSLRYLLVDLPHCIALLHCMLIFMLNETLYHLVEMIMLAKTKSQTTSKRWKLEEVGSCRVLCLVFFSVNECDSETSHAGRR